MNCPKDAIRFKKNGQAEIDHETCISCGKCHQSCLAADPELKIVDFKRFTLKAE